MLNIDIQIENGISPDLREKLALLKNSTPLLQKTGESPMNARLRMRIEFAKTLLLKGQTLKAIAAETGFCDPFHLSKTFKQVTGHSPRQFVESLEY